FQNNAATIFSLNLINWDDFINTPEAQLNQLVNYPLNRDLTPFEIQSRVRFSRYQPFLQKFRYFEKDEVFFEIGYYANLIGTRTGAKLGYSTLPFDVRVFPYEYRSMRFDQYGHIAEKVDQITNDGFEEKPKPTVGVKLMAELVEWEYGPFIGAFEPITAAAYDQFRNTLGFEVPKQYHWFIERMNKVKPEREIANFRITPGQWKTFEVFYEFEDLVHQYKQFHSAKGTKGELLPIARDTEGGHVLVDAINGTVYYHQNELIKTHSSFQELLTGCTNISSYFKPMRYHLEKDNTAMLRQWLSAGVDVNDEALFGGRKALRITRNREIVELLCQHGADPNDIFLFSEMGSDYVKMLVHHGLNLKAKLEAQLWFKREIMTNDEYKEFRDLVEE
ncbi:MAG: SMI1/KNR4 family protein, partial [Bacteroidota bacterium]